MNKKIIVLHHTGGLYKPNNIDRASYQMLITGDNQIILGNATPNATAGLNTISYNIACCAMFDKNYPIKKQQIELMCKCTAENCKKLNISPNMVFTHFEISEMVRDGSILKKLNIQNNSWLKNNIGKWDLKHLDCCPEIINVGDELRKKIKWYIANATN